MPDITGEIRYAVRLLLNNPGFTFVALLALTLGIGANSAIFSVVNGVLLHRLPYQDPDRLVMVWETNPSQSVEQERPSPGNFVDWREQNNVFDGMAGWYQASRTLRGEHDAQQVEVAQVAGDFFQVLGVKPAIGKAFHPIDSPGVQYNMANMYVSGDRIAVISDGLWRRRFNADPTIVGKDIMMDGRGWRVVAVMPASFAIPNLEVDMWTPWDMTRDRVHHDFRFIQVLARLKQSVTIQQANERLSVIAAELEKQYPKENKGWNVKLVSLHDQLVGKSRTALLTLFVAAVFVLLIACANVASLLLVRASARGREMAVRSALGASQFSLIRHSLIESVVLSVAGGASGLVLAFIGVRLLVSLKPANLPRLEEIGVDLRVCLFTFSVALFTGVLCGLIPALRTLKTDLAWSLKEGGTQGSIAGGHHRLRSLLVVSEVALALVLLIAAGLLARSFVSVLFVSPGFDPKNVLVTRIFLDNTSYHTAAQSTAYYRTLMEKIRTIPSVISVGGTTALPMSEVGVDFSRPYRREEDPDFGGGSPTTGVRSVTPDYFKAMGIAVKDGRSFTDDDRMDTTIVAVVNETLANRAWPNESPVGKRLVLDYNRGKYAYEVVGVAADTRFYGLKSTPGPEIFIPHAQNPYLIMNVVVRTSSNPKLLAKAVEQEVNKLDPAQPVHSTVTMDELVSASVAAERFSMLLLGVLSVIALILAAIGIYGIVAYLVTQRTREIGLRMALGAQPGTVLTLILSESFKLAVFGLVIGIIVALALNRLISSLLFRVSSTDALTFAGITFTLGVVALAAAYVPARRAARVDPMIALRQE